MSTPEDKKIGFVGTLIIGLITTVVGAIATPFISRYIEDDKQPSKPVTQKNQAQSFYNTGITPILPPSNQGDTIPRIKQDVAPGPSGQVSRKKDL